MKFVDVFQFFNYLLEEMSRCNCFSLQLVGGRLVGRTLEPKGEVCLGGAYLPLRRTCYIASHSLCLGVQSIPDVRPTIVSNER